MSEAPNTIFVSSWMHGISRKSNIHCGTNKEVPAFPQSQYTLTSSVQAQLKAADELAGLCIEAQAALEASGFNESLATDLLRTMTEYLKTKETT